MFSDDINDSWESSEFQNAFIKDYFGKRTPSTQKAKTSKKRISSSSEISTELQPIESYDDKSNLCSPKKKRKKPCNKQSCPKDEISIKNRNIKKNCLKDSLVAYSKSFKGEKSIKLKSKDKELLVEKPKVCASNSGLPQEDCSEDEDFKTVSNPAATKKTNLFLNKNYQKLQAAKFRYLNELLYTNTGKDSLDYFQQNTDEFEDYHVGYQSQVSKWPLNPVDIVIKELRKGKNLSAIADLGCGEAKIAESFPDRTVHSFDLIALKDCVTACDIAHVPLAGDSMDVAVFCLSLMGTNGKEYLLEGRRILKLGALLKIAEIESRIDNIDEFIKNIECYGFSLLSKNLSHKMFVFLNFKKVKKNVKASKVKDLALKPCLYKKR